MREIKFRIWDKALRKFVSSEYLHLNWDGAFIAVYDRANDVEIDDCNKDAVIQQWTGLQDKNGKEIYEGDILKYTFDGVTKINVIEFSPPIFTYRNSMRWSLDQDEVIGNIYENPDLLEDKHDN